MKRSNLIIALASVAIGVLALAEPAFASFLTNLVDPHTAGAILAFGPIVRGLQQKQADVVDRMRALHDTAVREDRDLTATEKAEFDRLKAEKESLTSRIATAQEMELAEAGLERTAAASAAAQLAHPNDGRTVSIPSAAILRVEENVDKDPKRGFMHFGDFARSIVVASKSSRAGYGIADKRLHGLFSGIPQAGAPSTFGNEAAGADGGFLVPVGFSTDVFQLSLAEDSLLPLTDTMNVDGNSMQIPKDETTPWGTTGVRAYWQAEGSAGSPTKPVLGMMDLRLKKLLALAPVSDELAADASALASYLPKKMALSIRWKTNEAILFGSGNGTPIGALTALPNSQGALVTVAKESGQAANTLQAMNLANMIARLPPGSYPNAVWLINNDVLPVLFTLTLGNYPIYLPGGAPTVGGIQTNPYGMLLGRPIIVSQHAKSLSSQGDVILLDLSYYQTITKSEGVTMATSLHLYFDADAMAFRSTFRVDGQPKLVAPISPANGSTKLSPFVQLGAR